MHDKLLLFNSYEFKETVDMLNQDTPPETETVKELLKWIFAPTKYRDFEAKKDPQTLERINLPEDEPRSYAPNVTVNIDDVKCTGERLLEVTFDVVATSGADNDDIVSVNLSLPSADCNGYRHKGLPHNFDTERECQSHKFKVEVKCSDLVSRSDEVVDVFIWTEVEVVDDDGNSRTVYLKLSSSKLNDVVKECCTKK